VPILRERTVLSSELEKEFAEGEYTWAYERPVPNPARIPWKESVPREAAIHLAACRDLLNALPEEALTDESLIKQAVWSYAEEKGKGTVLWPLRYALTAKEKSPDPFAVIHIIDKEETLARIDEALLTIRG